MCPWQTFRRAITSRRTRTPWKLPKHCFEKSARCRGGGEKMISPLSGERNLTMLTDLYQLTMANGYLQKGVSEKRAVFDLFYRGSGGYSYAVAAGLEQAVQYLRDLRFEEKDIAYLRSLGIFPENFLARLKTFRFTGDLKAIPEGTIDLPVRAHPHGVGAHLRGADHRDGAPYHRQSSDAHRHHCGEARRVHGREDIGVRAPSCAGTGRRHLRRACSIYRRLPLHVQRACGGDVRHRGGGHALPQLGDDLPHRARGVSRRMPRYIPTTASFSWTPTTP